MQNFVKTLIGLGITVGLSDRESFVKEVSALIHEYQDDPAKADKWAKATIAYLENMRDNINMQSAVKTVIEGESIPAKENIEKLTSAIEELTREVQKMKERK